jgi:hypothetical protein
MAPRPSSRILVSSALIALALVLAYPTLSCAPTPETRALSADSSQADKGKTERDRCKKADGTRAPGKDCPDGGERLPQDKRSPLDTIPPLSPLVA